MKVKMVAEFGFSMFVGLGVVSFFLPFGEPYKAILFGSAVLALFGRRLFWPLIKPSFCKHPNYTGAIYECPHCHQTRNGRACNECGRFEWL